MQTIPVGSSYGNQRNYCFDAGTPPVLKVQPGEMFAVETEDSYNGVLREDPTRLQPRDMGTYTKHAPFWYNPVCGPIYVEGAHRGDVLAVTIHGIDNMSTGTVTTVPGAHHFTGLRGWEETDEMYTAMVENSGTESMFTYGEHTYRWQPQPFIGTIATAPEFEVLSSLTTSFGSAMGCGGNLDSNVVRPGATVYLQSLNEGGLLFLGDLHASQGDGELCGVANEIAGRVTLSCNVVKKKRLRNVRVDTGESLISLYCYRPMEKGFQEAVRDMILWLEEDYGLSRIESYLLISICPEFRLRTYQMCSGLGRLMITVGAEFPKHLLPS